MSSVLKLDVLLLCLLFFSPLILLPALSRAETTKPSKDKYKFLFFASITGRSHYHNFAESSRVLVRQGHQVVSLVSSSNPTSLWEKDSDLFSFVIFNSSYTKQERLEVWDLVSEVVLTGEMNSFFGPLVNGGKLFRAGKLNVFTMLLQECSDLFADATTMKRLREEKFDMLIADDWIHCSPILAQALDIPFVLKSVIFAVPSRHGLMSGIPVDPSYIPERVLGLTDRMTFFQRVQNFLAHYYYWFLYAQLGSLNFAGYDQIKEKHNIKPEISTLEAHRQASLWFMHGSFGLEFPRPLNPNTIYVAYNTVSNDNHTIGKDVTQFLDSAPNGQVVLFAIGSTIKMLNSKQARLFADAFANLPYRVLWLCGTDLTELHLGNNVKVVSWLPLAKVMEHPNVRVYLTHGALFSTMEAMWNGLPMVAMPLFEDQMDNMVRVEHQGAGLSLEVKTLTSEILTQAIHRVMTEPKFRQNAQRVSQILRDLQTAPSPAHNVARWILHVTRFGGEHLRPAVLDLNYIQKNLLDVYLFLGLILVSVILVNLSVCRLCCRCMCRRGGHLKKD